MINIQHVLLWHMNATLLLLLCHCHALAMARTIEVWAAREVRQASFIHASVASDAGTISRQCHRYIYIYFLYIYIYISTISRYAKQFYKSLNCPRAYLNFGSNFFSKRHSAWSLCQILVWLQLFFKKTFRLIVVSNTSNMKYDVDIYLDHLEVCQAVL